MIEISGHWIDAGKISYVSPVEASANGTYSFCIVVDGAPVRFEFGKEKTVVVAHKKCARKSEAGRPSFAGVGPYCQGETVR